MAGESNDRANGLTAFDTIRSECWRGGRPLVPLFGAGLSADSGIPTTRPIEEYLHRLWCWLQINVVETLGKASGQRDASDLIREYLTRNGWPYRNVVNAEWATSSALSSYWEDNRHRLAFGKWWKWLDRLTNSDKELMEGLFNKLVRHATPNTAHQYAAFLAKSMNWRLILTTNFDSLIEVALREEQLGFTVFELPESGPLPEPGLVTGNPSVIHLHGGAFGLLAGGLLDVPLDFRSMRRFLEYIDKDALLLVLGYGGGDHRVVGLIEEHAERSKRSSETAPAVLWVVRDEATKIEWRNPLYAHTNIVWEKYWDGGSFLQELYGRLASSHPVSARTYRALTHIPPRILGDNNSPRTPIAAPASSQPDTDAQATVPDKNADANVIVFHRGWHGYGTSARLAKQVDQLVKSQSSGHDIIWCHLEQFFAVGSLISHLQREFRRHDPDLPQFGLFRVNGAANSDSAGVFSKNDPRIDWIVEAMKRGKYIVAVDSMGEFCPSLHSEEDGGLTPEMRRLRCLLKHLIARANEFGESRLWIAFAPQSQSDEKGFEHFALHYNASCVMVSEMKASRKPLYTPKASAEDRCGLQSLVGLVDDGLKVTREEIKQQVLDSWKSALPNSLRALLLVSSVFRRSRSIVALRRLVVPLFSDSDIDSMSGDGELASFFENVGMRIKRVWNHVATPRQLEALDQMLRQMLDRQWMFRQEGGFYWMHRIVHEALRDVARSAPNSASEGAPSAAHNDRSEVESKATILSTLWGDLNDLVAIYYYEQLFRHSGDRSALIEYLYHRRASLMETLDAAKFVKRLEDLDAVLRRERDFILTHRQSDALVAWIDEFEMDVLGTHMTARFPQPTNELSAVDALLRATLCDLKAEVLRQARDVQGWIGVRLKQLRDRLRESGVAENHADVEDLEKLIGSSEWGFNRSLVKPLVNSLKQSLIPAAALVDTADAKKVSNGYRLVEEIIDVAAWVTAIGVDADESTHDQGHARPLLLAVKDFIYTNDRHRRGRGHGADWVGVSLARRALARCYVRLMESCVFHLSMWIPERCKKEFDGLLDFAERMFEEGRAGLQYFTEWEARDHAHYICHLYCWRARAMYLRCGQRDNDANAGYQSAHQFLDNAEAALKGMQTGSDRTALAVCKMFRAECLMLDANDRLQRTEGASDKSTTEKVRKRARLYLHRARIELNSARDLMVVGRPHVAWWTRWHALSAQRIHERLLWQLDDQGSESLDVWMAPVDKLVKYGCDYCRAGIACASGDTRSQSQLRTLVRQLAIVYGAVRVVNMPGTALLCESSLESAFSSLRVEYANVDFEELHADSNRAAERINVWKTHDSGRGSARASLIAFEEVLIGTTELPNDRIEIGGSQVDASRTASPLPAK